MVQSITLCYCVGADTPNEVFVSADKPCQKHPILNSRIKPEFNFSISSHYLCSLKVEEVVIRL